MTWRPGKFIYMTVIGFAVLLFFVLSIPKLIVSPTNYATNAYGIGSTDLLNPLRLGVVRLLGIGADRWDAANNSPLVYAIFYDNEPGVRELVAELPCEHLSKVMARIRTEGFRRSGSQLVKSELMERCADKHAAQN